MSAQNVYWDAAVFNAVFGEEIGRVDICKRIQERAAKGEIILYTSYLTWVECIWLKGEPKLSNKHEAVIQKYFEHKYIRPIYVDRPRAEAARSLIWKYSGLHPKDAIHVASAVSIGVDVLHTYDEPLIKLSGKIAGLKICKPGDEAIEKDFALIQESTASPKKAPPRPDSQSQS